MFADRTLRNIFIATLGIAIILPLISIYIIYPMFGNSLLEKTREEALHLTEHLKEHEFELAVRDDGIGIPGDIDIRNTNTLGLQLVTSITEEQLGGKLEIMRDGGAGFRIRLRELEYEPRT